MQSCLMPVCACKYRHLKSPMYHNAKLCDPFRSLFSKPTLSLTTSESLLGYPRALPLSSQLPSSNALHTTAPQRQQQLSIIIITIIFT